MVEYVSYALTEAAKGAAVLLHAPGLVDPFLEELAKKADRWRCFDEGSKASLELICREYTEAG